MKKKIISLSTALLLITGTTAQERVLTDTEKVLGLSRLWEGVRSNFVYYDRMQLDWDSLYEASIPEVLKTKDAYAYIKELERIVAYAGDGHTFIGHTIEPAHEERITPLPFTTRLVDDQVLVDKVYSTDLVNRGVVRGVEVISVNNQDVFAYAEKELGQYFPTSTPQWLHYRLMNQFQLTKGKRTDPIAMEFVGSGKKISVSYPNRELNWDIQEDQRKKERRNGIQNEYEDQTLSLTLLENNIGLLKVSSFNDKDFNRKFDQVYPSILSTDALIIDLRDNEGGASSYADYILRHLSEKPIKTSSWSSRMYIPVHASWGWEDEWYRMASSEMNPVDGERYARPIAVMVDAGTFSSSEDFLVKFRGMKRGPIIGNPTGGSTGNGVRITLIEGVAWANICSKADIAPDGTVFVGVGVIPDIEVTETKEDFLTHKDTVLEKAISEVNRIVNSRNRKN